MNKEKKLKPMTIEEEYRNADVPMPFPEDEFKKAKKLNGKMKGDR